jgi:hypothetical protein
VSTDLDDILGDERPVFSPKCPQCGRFFGGTVMVTYNGFGDVVKSEATCGRCGDITPELVCWSGDLREDW